MGPSSTDSADPQQAGQSGAQPELLKRKSSKISKVSRSDSHREYREGWKAYVSAARAPKHDGNVSALEAHLGHYPLAVRLVFWILISLWALPMLIIWGLELLFYETPRQWIKNRRVNRKLQRGETLSARDLDRLSEVDKSVVAAQDSTSTRSASIPPGFNNQPSRGSASVSNMDFAYPSSVKPELVSPRRHSTPHDFSYPARAPTRTSQRRSSGPVVDAHGHSLPPPQIPLAVWHAQNRMSLSDVCAPSKPYKRHSSSIVSIRYV